MAERKQERKQKHSRKQRSRQSEINIAMFLFQASHFGNHVDLKDVLFSEKLKPEKRWIVLNAKDADGNPIVVNCVKGARQATDEDSYVECIKVLVSTGLSMDAKDSQGRTALHWAVLFDKVKIGHELILGQASITLTDNEGLSPMHIAIEQKHKEFVEMLCQLGPKQILEAADSVGRTPLCHALYVDSLPLFTILLFADANADGLTNDGKRLITYVIENGRSDYLDALLNHCANLFPAGANQFNMIHLAACQKNPASLEVIAAHCSKVEMEKLDENGRSPLMFAVMMGLHKNVQILIEMEVNVEQTDSEGKSALHYTYDNPDDSCCNILLSKCSLSIDALDCHNRSAAHLAIDRDNRAVLAALLKFGADGDMLDPSGHTLIHWATEYCALGCLEELIVAGVTPNTPDSHGTYPIHYAVQPNDEENWQMKLSFLKKLLEVGASLDVMDGDGLQPVHWASVNGNDSALEILLSGGANVNAVTRDGHLTSLHLACNAKQVKCLSLLVESPTTEIDKADKSGFSSLFYACGSGNKVLTEILLKGGASTEVRSLDGRTPAHAAAGCASIDCLWLLSDNNANMNGRSNSGETPLHAACMKQEEACVRFLLSKNCEVNAAQKNGRTPLHISVTRKNSALAQLLLENDANVNALLHAKEQLTALDIALQNADFLCIRILQEHGARTAHAILSNAALLIQQTWRQFQKRNKTKKSTSNGDRENNSTLTTSSNFSESISVRAMKRHGCEDHDPTTLKQSLHTIMTVPQHLDCNSGEHMLKDDDEVCDLNQENPQDQNSAQTMIQIRSCQQAPCCACSYQCNTMCSNASGVLNSKQCSTKLGYASSFAPPQCSNYCQFGVDSNPNIGRGLDSCCIAQLECCTSQLRVSPAVDMRGQQQEEEDLLADIQRQLKESREGSRAIQQMMRANQELTARSRKIAMDAKSLVNGEEFRHMKKINKHHQDFTHRIDEHLDLNSQYHNDHFHLNGDLHINGNFLFNGDLHLGVVGRGPQIDAGRGFIDVPHHDARNREAVGRDEEEQEAEDTERDPAESGIYSLDSSH